MTKAISSARFLRTLYEHAGQDHTDPQVCSPVVYAYPPGWWTTSTSPAWSRRMRRPQYRSLSACRRSPQVSATNWRAMSVATRRSFAVPMSRKTGSNTGSSAGVVALLPMVTKNAGRSSPPPPAAPAACGSRLTLPPPASALRGSAAR